MGNGKAATLPTDPSIADVTPDVSTAPAFAQWRQLGRTAGMQAIPAGMIVDAGSDTMWPANLATLYASYASWPSAVTGVTPSWATQLPWGSETFEIPASADYGALASASGGYPSSWTASQSSSISAYLSSVGFSNVYGYFWESDTGSETTATTAAAATATTTTAM